MAYGTWALFRSKYNLISCCLESNLLLLFAFKYFFSKNFWSSWWKHSSFLNLRTSINNILKHSNNCFLLINFWLSLNHNCLAGLSKLRLNLFKLLYFCIIFVSLICLLLNLIVKLLLEKLCHLLLSMCGSWLALWFLSLLLEI